MLISYPFSTIYFIMARFTKYSLLTSLGMLYASEKYLNPKQTDSFKTYRLNSAATNLLPPFLSKISSIIIIIYNWLIVIARRLSFRLMHSILCGRCMRQDSDTSFPHRFYAHKSPYISRVRYSRTRHQTQCVCCLMMAFLRNTCARRDSTRFFCSHDRRFCFPSVKL